MASRKTEGLVLAASLALLAVFTGGLFWLVDYARAPPAAEGADSGLASGLAESTQLDAYLHGSIRDVWGPDGKLYAYDAVEAKLYRPQDPQGSLELVGDVVNVRSGGDAGNGATGLATGGEEQLLVVDADGHPIGEIAGDQYKPK